MPIFRDIFCISNPNNVKLSTALTRARSKTLVKEPLSWIFENDCGVEYSSKGMKTSCKDLYLKVHRI